MKGKTHDLNQDLIFSAHTINCMCHSIRSMFRVLGIYNFAVLQKCGHAKGEARFRASSVVTRSVELNVDIVKGL